MTVTAKGQLGGHDIEAEVLNPGDWWGKVWLIGHACGCSMIWFVVEADHEQDAFDIFADHEKRGHLIQIGKDQFEDYGSEFHVGDMAYGDTIEEDGWYDLNGKKVAGPLQEPTLLGNAGTPCDISDCQISKWVCKYYDPADLDCDGIDPELYSDREQRFFITKDMSATEDTEYNDVIVACNFRTEKDARKWLEDNKLDWHDYTIDDRNGISTPDNFKGYDASNPGATNVVTESTESSTG